MADGQYRGQSSIRTPGGTRERSVPIEVDVRNGRHRVRLNGLGEAEVDVGKGGEFSDAPFATTEGQINRARGVVETGPDAVHGGFTVERDGKEILRGRFHADKIHQP